jgi:hypothetical protein
MNKRYDVCSPRKRTNRDGETKTYWCKVGTAWENDKGITIAFDALPLPDEKGEARVALFEPKPKDGAAQREPAKASTPIDLDDEIPF